MLQLNNHTRLQAVCQVLPDIQGEESVYIALKGSFQISPKLALLEEQLPLTQEDVFWGEPAASSVRYPSDINLGKVGSDILLLGQAWAPGGHSLPHCMVDIAVAEQRMQLAVLGNRYWQSGRISEPEPFTRMPLIFENAYGGQQLETGLAEERNPVGKGFCGELQGSDVDGIALPNLEHPGQLIQRPGDSPLPVAPGAIAPAWLPRRQYAGTYDEVWQKTRAPWLPEDFDLRFFNVAHPLLTTTQALQGGESVSLGNVSQQGELQFKVPFCPIEVLIDIAGSKQVLPLVYQTLTIEPDLNRFSIVWQASCPCDKQVTQVRSIDINRRKPS